MALGLAALGLYRVYPWRGGLRRRRGARSPHEQPQDYHSLTTTHCSRVLQCLISARHLAWQRGHITYSVNFRDLLVAPGDATLEHCCWNIRKYKVVLNLHNVASTQIIRDGLGPISTLPLREVCPTPPSQQVVPIFIFSTGIATNYRLIMRSQRDCIFSEIYIQHRVERFHKCCSQYIYVLKV